MPEPGSCQFLNRREFLIGLGTLAAVSRLDISQPAIFQEMPADRSGIVWAHENGMSPEHYLPETLGPGCAFLDYDNDGWMDVYLVNSGPQSSMNPSGRFATLFIATTAMERSRMLPSRLAWEAEHLEWE